MAITGKKYKIGLIGAGRMGERWAKVIRGSPIAELSLVVDPNKEVGEKIALPVGATYLPEFPKKNVSVDAFFIVTPHAYLYQNARRALQFNKPVFIIPGNWDQSYSVSKTEKNRGSRYQHQKFFLDAYLSNSTNKFLTKGLKNIKDCQYRLFCFQNINILGYGLSSGPEFIKERAKSKVNKRELNSLKKGYFKLISKLNKVYSKRNQTQPTIFLTHNVPYNTKIDIILDKNSPLNRQHFGSVVAREFCKKHKPLICIGGHMHEHFRKDKLSKTVLVNAGFGSFVNVLLELKGNKITKLKFKRG